MIVVTGISVWHSCWFCSALIHVSSQLTTTTLCEPKFLSLLLQEVFRALNHLHAVVCL